MAVVADLTRGEDSLSLNPGYAVGDCHARRRPNVHEAEMNQRVVFHTLSAPERERDDIQVQLNWNGDSRVPCLKRIVTNCTFGRRTLITTTTPQELLDRTHSKGRT